ncbi:MAG: hypothetical protein L3J12_08205, partial [Spirochaetales bacterium]|nr:hypothetical protein [Spirochaetales bacterium]
TNNSDNWALGRAMLEDQVGLNWGNGIYTKEDGTEVSYNGLFDRANEDNITVNEALKSLKMEDIAKLAAVLSHENTHRLDYKAGRDTFEATAHYNGLNTYNDLKNAFDLNGDSTFFMQMISALMEPGSYLANAGGVDFWKLVTDEHGNSSLEYDGRADIYDEDGNFLVGAGTSPYAIQTALSKYLGVSMDEAFDSMKAAGMTADGNTWRGNALEGNMGKRIAIGGANDMNTTDYIFAAHNIGEIRSEIEQQYDISGSVDGARETLLANGWNIGLNNQGPVASR